ncbi:MAG: PilZ domain-containing protein [Desulfocapsaceae bacterium]|nr:PilZ domain-containing protein [Desulfocapsaceae bacterium]
MKMNVKANIGKNRLHLTFTGRAVKEDLKKLYTDIRFCVADLTPGFDVISDFSQCSLMHISGISVFRKIMNYLISNGAGEIVRVINRRSLLYKQVRNLSSRICGYCPIYVSTLEEAEERLLHTAKRNGIRLTVNRLPVVYTINEQEGEGRILNLSTSGCAIAKPGTPVSENEEVSIKILFKDHTNSADEFDVTGKVVRTAEDMFAVEFKDMDDEGKERLWKHLIDEIEGQSQI